MSNKNHGYGVSGLIVGVKKTFRYSNVFFYNHLYHPECIYEKRYICNLVLEIWDLNSANKAEEGLTGIRALVCPNW